MEEDDVAAGDCATDDEGTKDDMGRGGLPSSSSSEKMLIEEIC
jgi:hypothetical protein